MIKISIIIPIYNVEPYIQECLKTVADQSLTENLECILVDDCGTDNSVSIAEKFIDSYSGPIKFSLLHHKQNGGLSAARNTGIKAAQGEYIYFLDSDDTITTNCMEVMYSHVLAHPGVDLVEGSYVPCRLFMNEYKKDNTFNYTENRKIIKSSILNYVGSNVSAQKRLLRRQMIIEKNLFFHPGIIHEDNHWSFYLAKNVMKMSFCFDKLYFHRDNPDSITHNINLEREIFSYSFVLNDFCNNIDQFMKGHQLELIMSTFLTVVRNGYYKDDQSLNSLRKLIISKNNLLEKLILKFYFGLTNERFKFILFSLLRKIYHLRDNV